MDRPRQGRVRPSKSTCRPLSRGRRQQLRKSPRPGEGSPENGGGQGNGARRGKLALGDSHRVATAESSGEDPGGTGMQNGPDRRRWNAVLDQVHAILDPGGTRGPGYGVPNSSAPCHDPARRTRQTTVSIIPPINPEESPRPVPGSR
ncbi:MAG: hypothetical protein MZU79_01780 [Anaerotruncus sp.]|nr:hypothetical protein [Anaerotruncus sp.]